MARDIWLISDTHFGHQNIITYCNRPFKTADEMDDYITTMWNETVKPGDIIYHLGDVYFSKAQKEWGSFFAKLHGSKRLILGNHDNGKDKYIQNTFNKILMWRMFPDFGLLLTHVPVHPESLFRVESKMVWSNNEQKYLHEETFHYMKNIHGHTHTNAEPGGDKKRYKCICVELINYKPVNIEDLRIK